MSQNVLGYNACAASAVRLFKSGMRAVLVEGPPGVGKSAMKEDIAAGAGLKHIFMLKLSHHEVTDVAGVPVPNDDDKRTYFYASGDMLPPSDLQGGCLFVFDEGNDCNVAQQNLMCQAVFEGRFHNYVFPENTKFLITGNRVQDRSGANRIVTKLSNRVAVITLAPTPDELFEYGARHGWNPTVLAFIKMRGMERINPSDARPNAPTYFNSFDPSDAHLPQFASSRSYEFASDYMNYVADNEPNLDAVTMVPDLTALLGGPVATTLAAFHKIAATMPDPDLILAGKYHDQPKKEEVRWALALSLCAKVKKDTLKNMATYMEKGPEEYMSMVVRILFDTRAAELTGPDFLALITNKKLAAVFAQ